MTRGPNMAETRWSLDAGTPADTLEVESTSTAPPVCSYRAMYRHSLPAGSLSSGEGTGTSSLSPDQPLATPNPSVLSAPPEGYAISPAEWAQHRDRDHYFPLDLARIQLKPKVKTSVSRTPEFDSVGRSVNERLDKYVVIRQRTFHGLPRTRKEMRILPLTDPRETVSADSTPTWLHRSKTDMYIEKWRSKASKKHLQRSKSGSAYDLRGMTMGSLYESLPRAAHGVFSSPNSPRKEVTFAPEATMTRVSNGSETRFPPLSPNLRKRHSEPNTRTSSQRDQLDAVSVSTSRSPKYPSPTPKEAVASRVHILPTPEGREAGAGGEAGGGGGNAKGGEAGGKVEASSDPPSGADTAQEQSNSPPLPKGKGKLRNQPLAAIPLQLWEPSFECVVVSSQKLLQPRQRRGWPGTAVRQQPSPLK